MPELGSATYELRGNHRQFKKTMGEARGEVLEFRSEVEKADESVVDFDKSLAKNSDTQKKYASTTDGSRKGLMGLSKEFVTGKRDVDNHSRALQNAFGVMKAIKWPAIFAGVGVAAQAVGGLSTGIIGVTSALGPMIGLAAAVPVLYGSLGAAAGTLKLAFGGLGDAIKGNEEALKKLGPAGKEFVKFVNETLKPFKKELQDIAQKQLLPKLTQGIKSAFNPGNLKGFESIVKQMAGSIGNVFKTLGDELKKSQWAADLPKMGGVFSGFVESIGKTVVKLLPAFRDLTIASKGLMEWIGKGLERFGDWASGAAAAGRESGKLQGFFERTKEVTGIFLGMLKDLGSFLMDMGGAASGPGMTMLKDLADQLDKLAKWGDSEGGKQTMREYFKNTKPVLYEVLRLVRDIAAVFFRLSNEKPGESGILKTLQNIRKEVLPVFEAVSGSAMQNLAPALGETLGKLLKLFGELAGENGPLVMLVKYIGDLAESLSFLLENVPGLKSLVFFMVGMKTVGMAAGFTKAILGITAASKLGPGLLIAARGMRILAAATATFGAKATIAATAQWALNEAVLANPYIAVAAAIIAVAAAFVILYIKVEAFRDFVNRYWPTLIALLTFGPVIAGLVFLEQKFGIFSEAAVAVFNALKSAAQSVVDFFTNNWKVIATILAAPFMPLVALATDMWGVRTAITNAAQAVIDFLTTAWNTIKTTATTVWNAIQSAATTTWNAIKTAIMTPIDAVSTLMTTVWNTIKTGLTTVWNAIELAAKTTWGLIKAAVMTPMNTIDEVLKTLWNGIKTTLTTIWNALKTAAETAWSGIKTAISTVVNYITDTVIGTFNNLKDIGTSVWDAMKEAAKKAAGLFESAVSPIISAIDWVIGKLQTALDLWNRLKQAATGGGLDKPTTEAPGAPPSGDPFAPGGPGAAKGALIPGKPGAPVPILAHAGEMVLNQGQQNALGGTKFLANLFGFEGSYATGGVVGAHATSGETFSMVGPPMSKWPGVAGLVPLISTLRIATQAFKDVAPAKDALISNLGNLDKASADSSTMVGTTLVAGLRKAQTAMEKATLAALGYIKALRDAATASSTLANTSAAMGGGGTSTMQGPGYPGLAKGGIVRKPTLAWIGEAGPEAVIPLPKNRKPSRPGGDIIAWLLAKLAEARSKGGSSGDITFGGGGGGEDSGTGWSEFDRPKWAAEDIWAVAAAMASKMGMYQQLLDTVGPSGSSKTNGRLLDLIFQNRTRFNWEMAAKGTRVRRMLDLMGPPEGLTGKEAAAQFGLAKGGILNAPTWMLGGEKGKEAVIPLDSRKGIQALAEALEDVFAAGKIGRGPQFDGGPARIGKGANVQISQTFTQPPEDPHIYARSLAFELGATL